MTAFILKIQVRANPNRKMLLGKIVVFIVYLVGGGGGGVNMGLRLWMVLSCVPSMHLQSFSHKSFSSASRHHAQGLSTHSEDLMRTSIYED
jgi:hypothetical protein